ncbi:DUF2165 family protein [Endozoicomonas arenosclerae]|uniref:DUF2165 family protein n=1 Tax=Endozoicomonas arenosclerae TaxID=1633495 RepID=UPI0007862BB5|nr:DUF2165 domain-containing protein [Endozoicomonas arenosclerae]
MTLRLCKILLVSAAALFSSLVVFNNLVDYQSNYLYVMHVMSMDTTGYGEQASWRAIHNPWLWQMVYGLIIAIEAAVAILCWLGVIKMLRNVRGDFHSGKQLAVLGLTLGVVLWFLVFMGISGEWFLAWQSKSWNGIQPGFRVATLFLLMLIFISQEEK